MSELVEEFRSTGYSGREPSIAGAPPILGTRATALRQLEVMATHIASAWLDGDMNERELSQFVKDCLLPDVLALAQIIEATFRSTPPLRFEAACLGAKHLIWDLSNSRVDQVNTGGIVVSFLIATMVLRQLVEGEIAPSDGNGVFRCSSTNVAPQFFDRCISVLGRCPFGATEGVPLAELERKLEELPRDTPQLTSKRSA
jgi:hypothetical protein